jgi:hypothetical protein
MTRKMSNIYDRLSLNFSRNINNASYKLLESLRLTAIESMDIISKRSSSFFITVLTERFDGFQLEDLYEQQGNVLLASADN